MRQYEIARRIQYLHDIEDFGTWRARCSTTLASWLVAFKLNLRPGRLKPTSAHATIKFQSESVLGQKNYGNAPWLEIQIIRGLTVTHLFNMAGLRRRDW
jgi:hypothetical protein